MDYGDLRYIQKEERIGSSLSKVDSSFDEEIKQFLHPSSDTDVRLARSMMVCAKDVCERDFVKLLIDVSLMLKQMLIQKTRCT